MLPQPKKKAHVISDLEVSEVSLCDFGSNSEYDPRTGKRIARSTVALHKRDSSGGRYLSRSELVRHMDRVQAERTFQKKEKKMSELQKVLKSAPSRDAICEVIKKRAEKRAKKTGVPVEQAEAAEWQKHPEALQAYTSAPKSEPRKPQPRTAQITSAEAELDSRARQRMKKTGESYAKACSAELMADPTLYQKYEAELAAGKVYTAPAPVEFSDPTLTKRGKAAGDDGECPECGGDVDEDDSFCSGCGADLSKAKRGRKPAA